MPSPTVTESVVGSRVCSATGDRHGSVTATEKPYVTMDQLLYTIRWDDGETVKLYYESFVALGHFQTLGEFQTAIRASASGAKLTLGPKGGFRAFEMTVQRDGVTLSARYGSRDGAVYHQFIEPFLQKPPAMVQLERRRSTRKAV
jgi:hypothetical protein